MNTSFQNAASAFTRRASNALLTIALLTLYISLAGCESSTVPTTPDEDPITTVQITFTNALTSDATTYTWEDADGPGANPPNQTDTIRLSNGTVYRTEVKFLNRTATGLVDVTPDIVSEANNHQVFYTVEPSLFTVTITDTDPNGKPLGITTLCSNTTKGTATFNLSLSHFPDSTKKDGVNPSDETDVDVPFVLVVD